MVAAGTNMNRCTTYMHLKDPRRKELVECLNTLRGREAPPAVLPPLFWAGIWFSDLEHLEAIVTEFSNDMEECTTKVNDDGNNNTPVRRSKSISGGVSGSVYFCYPSIQLFTCIFLYIFLVHQSDRTMLSGTCYTIHPVLVLNHKWRAPTFGTLRCFWNPDKVNKWHQSVEQASTESHHWDKQLFALGPIERSDDKSLWLKLYWLRDSRIPSFASEGLSRCEAPTMPSDLESGGSISKYDVAPNLRLYNYKTDARIVSRNTITIWTEDPDGLPLPEIEFFCLHGFFIESLYLKLRQAIIKMRMTTVIMKIIVIIMTTALSPSRLLRSVSSANPSETSSSLHSLLPAWSKFSGHQHTILKAYTLLL
ncbi:conserved hypothetical protein [Microsporum canis CBS 113480]|uniref:Uncharacterized protein n=1 Tax=Arthroderma otae (strain ATCC MYA-4605 / CBS 113480) TaxID=554155 RepID=C5G0Q9_ARTOC|nr:conserved hypothetical protein [Microsporum canis CBS 113480]EEQ35712.1 conserved hypothetical protein [Microsporum canis CBS 113480]